MHFTAETPIAYPARVVVDTMMNRMHDLVVHLPNVESIDTQLIEPQPDGTVKTVRHWQGTAKSVPAVMRPFVSRRSLGWMDYAVWYPDELRCEWRTVSDSGDLTACSGTNAFRASGDGSSCVMVIDGDFIVHGERLPGVPAFMGRKIAPTIERIVLSFMKPNFTSSADGLKALLDSERGAS
ncbi:MAG: hypothetical protein KC635_01420 [Myxococcales bacterium]|nr:hypothetical protein [Myxococcales bacterium]MCB9733637.1 hypothetical protein [Deltaproteobacteria bacterium]